MSINRKSWTIFGAVFLVYIIGSISIELSPISTWRSHTTITHTLMQSIATVLAFFCGVATLYRYYGTPIAANSMLLFIGVGFLGTGIIDAYHALVTSAWFVAAFPKIPPSVAEWSWLATRMFLAFLFVLSLLFSTAGKGRAVHPRSIYISIGLLVLLTFGLFLFIRAPYPVYPEQFIARPFELIPGFFFLIVMIGYFIDGSWETDRTFFWLMLFLLTSMCTQFFYIDLCKKSHDTLYLMSHFLKIVSYSMVYISIPEEK